MLLAVFAAVALPIPGCLGATLYAEKSQTVRREPPAESLQMGAHGEMIQVSSANADSTSHMRIDGEGATAPDTLVTNQEALDDMATQFCDFDFPTGKTGSNNCTHPTNQSLILQENMCIFAASEAGATTSHSSFKEPSEWENVHPKGCFKYSCSEAANNVCYFYNGDGDWPNGDLKGTPICSRPKHLNGTRNSAAADAGCPAGYEVIDHGDTCFKTAGCLGYCTGSEFRIGEQNASKHLEYPRGCFIDNTDGCVYYNGPNALGRGTSVSGTPICNVSKVTTWPETATS